MCVLVNNGIEFVDISPSSTNCEIVAIDLAGIDGSLRLMCVYASPSGSADMIRDRITAVTEVLDNLCPCEHPTIIVGDFNLPNID